MLAKYDLMSLSRALLSKHFWLMSCAGSLNLYHALTVLPVSLMCSAIKSD